MSRGRPPGNFWSRVDKNGPIARVRQMCAKAEIAIVSPHALRRTFVTLSGARGVTLKDRQLAVSHNSQNTTERYDRARNAAGTKVGNVFASLVHG